MTIRDVTADVFSDARRPLVLVHVVNDVGRWGAGFTAGLSRRYVTAFQDFQAWTRGGPADSTLYPSGVVRSPYRLGGCRLTRLTAGERPLVLAQLCAQEGLPSRSNRHPFSPDAFRVALQVLAAVAAGRPLAMPRIGEGLGGGDPRAIRSILDEEVGELDVTVYTLPGNPPAPRL